MYQELRVRSSCRKRASDVPLLGWTLGGGVSSCLCCGCEGEPGEGIQLSHSPGASADGAPAQRLLSVS